ncbi:MAG: sulfotransferase family protein [Solirubrobacteraceae bacterium]
MKLIGAGFPRTGTLSQKLALEMLGFGPCYHMVNVLADLPQAALWDRALDGEAPWSELFDGYSSTVDWPGGYFYKELMVQYPEAKVLLSTRDPEAWEKSMRGTVCDVRQGRSVMRLLSDARGQIDPDWAGFLRMIDRLLWTGNGSFADGHAEPGQLIDGMRRHEAEVRRNVAPERLLVWRVTEGWEPLCEFLEVSVPDMPFPRVNDSREFVDRVIDGALITLTEWRRSSAAEPSPAAAR